MECSVQAGARGSYLRRGITVVFVVLITVLGMAMGPAATAATTPVVTVPPLVATVSPAPPESAVKWKQITGGWYHMCGLTTGGAVYCWGQNTYGQLGTGNTADTTLPAPVVGLSSGIASIELGFEHSCALTTEGAVKCWGSNSRGQLGDGTTKNSNVPVAAQGLPKIKAVSGGSAFTCAITEAGGAKCWGINTYQELGALFNGDWTAKPVDVWGLQSGVTSVDAGSGTACATTTSGAWCWGDNAWGQLGLGTFHSPIPVPVQIPDLGAGTTAAQPQGGRNMCALINGNVKCSGQDRSGNLGARAAQGGVTNKLLDVQGLQSSDVVQLATANTRNCALTTAGAVKCWGSNQSGGLGNGDASNGAGTDAAVYDYKPVTPLGLESGVASIAMGDTASCVIKTDGSAWCWGHNAQGQVGRGDTRLMVNVPIPLGIGDSPKITTTQLPNARQGIAYSTALTGNGGLAPYRWDIAAGTLPDGLSLNRNTGQITGTPAKAGSYGIALRVTDARGAVGWSAPRWVDDPKLGLAVDPPESTTPVIASVSIAKSGSFNRVTVAFTFSGSATDFDLQCQNASGNSTSSTSGSRSPLSVSWSATQPVQCRVRANTKLGYSNWTPLSALVSPPA